MEDDYVLEDRLNTVFDMSTSGVNNDEFSMSIDATTVMKTQHLSTSYKSVTKGSHQNNFILVEGKTKEEVLQIIEN